MKPYYKIDYNKLIVNDVKNFMNTYEMRKQSEKIEKKIKQMREKEQELIK